MMSNNRFLAARADRAETTEQMADEMIRYGMNPYTYIGVTDTTNPSEYSDKVYNRIEVAKLMNRHRGAQCDIEYITKFSNYSRAILNDPIQRARFECPESVPDYGNARELKKQINDEAWKRYISCPATYATYNKRK